MDYYSGPFGKTYYAVLEIEHHADEAEIRAARNRLAKEYHPDRVPEHLTRLREEAQARLAIINEAYAILSNSAQRQQYDDYLGYAARNETPIYEDDLANDSHKSWDPTQEHDLDNRLYQHFEGRVVRKDLTQKIKEGANVPIFVLEYLLGTYCTSNDPEAINEGVASVKKILSDNYVRPDEAEKVKSKIRESNTYTIIDKVTVKLNTNKDVYEAELQNLTIKGLPISANIVTQFQKLLGGGIWCIMRLSYFFEEGSSNSPFRLESIKPIQLANLDMDELYAARKEFTRAEWIDVVLRSVGMEPTTLPENAKWHLLNRLVPLCENNYNCCELGPRSTGKSYIYKEISPNSILISGGQTTVANLFYNLARRQVGLVGLWDVVAFDEVAGITFKDKDGVQIMKDYMASGSFARGKAMITGSASMVFVGNINESVEHLVRSSHLLSPFPEAMIDSAFFDRFHSYIPGWEIPKFRPENFTNRYGFISDYLAEWLRELRKKSMADAIDKYFKLGNNLNQRDVQGVKKTVSGLLKVLFPNEDYSKEDVRDCLVYALRNRRRVKEQLKKIGGMEFYDVNFSYIDNESMEEHFVSVPESGGDTLIPPGPLQPGHVHTIAAGDNDRLGAYRIETISMKGSGKLVRTGGASSALIKDASTIAFNFFKGNAKRVSASIKPENEDYHCHLVDLQGVGTPRVLSLALLVALCSAAQGRAIQEQIVILGDMTLGGTVNPVQNLAATFQVAFDAGAKRILLPMASAADIPSVPPELFSKFQISFYSDPIDGVYKAMGL